MKSGIVLAGRSDLQAVDATADLLDRLGTFLRINVAEGDASEHTIRAYKTHIVQFVEWCEEQGIQPAVATEQDLALYRRYLAIGTTSGSGILARSSPFRDIVHPPLHLPLYPRLFRGVVSFTSADTAASPPR